MSHLLAEIDAWHLWVIAGIIFCMLEIFTPGFFLMAIGAGCFLAALGSLMMGLNWQIVLFILGAIAFFFASRRIMSPNESEPDQKFGMERLVGKMGITMGPVSYNAGYVKIAGEKWPARSEDKTVIPEATAVEIYAFSGNKLNVRVRKE